MKFSFFKNHFNYRIANRFIFSLIALDVIFILIHVVFVYLIYKRIEFDWSISKLFKVNEDGGYPEMFQYLKYLIVIIAIIYIMHKKKIYNYISWLFLFVLLLFDDAFMFHERAAVWIGEKFNFKSMLGLRPEDLGELSYAAGTGLVLLLFLILGYYYGNKMVRKTYLDLGMLFALFLFFGIGIDMLHMLVGDNRFILLFVILLEDGGEMITLSFITWYFFFLTIRPESHNTYLYQFLNKRNK